MTDIWELHSQGYWPVIPTNLEYNRAGEAIMGAGLARQAYSRFPGLGKTYGGWLQLPEYWSTKPMLYMDQRVVCLATKRRWREDSDLTLITAQLHHLTCSLVRIPNINLAMPRIGCGLGRLKWEEVKPVIQDILPAGRYIFCEE